MKEKLFDKAEETIKEINLICQWAADERTKVFKKFKDNVCAVSITKDNKKVTFEDLSKWVDATEFICPETKELCAELRLLLGSGITIKCGGS